MDINSLKSSPFAKNFPKGTVIAAEGNSGDAMYIVIEGAVDVFKNYQKPDEKKFAALKPGNFFGETALFLQKEYATTEVAAEDSVLLEVGRAATREFLQGNPELSFLVIKTLCQRLENANRMLAAAPQAGAASPAPSAAPMPALKLKNAPAEVIQAPEEGESLIEGLLPQGHKLYKFETPDADPGLIYKKMFDCPVCENRFAAMAVRTTKLKAEQRDKDFRNHYKGVDTTYYEIITCPSCYFSMFDAMFPKPIVARFKEQIGQISEFKQHLGGDMVEDRNINNVFAGYYLALKGAPLFYKDHEMNTAKIWLRLKWLYEDVGDLEMAAMAVREAHKAYLTAFERTDAMPEVIQQLCVLVAELSLIIKDIPSAKLFFVKARSYRNGSKAMISQAEDGIETLRKIEAGQIRL
ncbi:MAG: DUF2225 domain-containing protein [Defluviitaleaceae bacterium]|nr:DUF2225 domain-containing protein [Defluviitaleaceae bacterium]